MSKYTAVRPATIVDDQKEIDAFLAETLGALEGLFISFDDCRNTVIEALAEKIDDEAVNAFISETITSIDQISSHHSIEEISVGGVSIVSLKYDAIYFKVTGSLSVELQWGSNSDVSRGDGALLKQSFPFEVTMKAPVDDPSAFEEVSAGVDTGDWFGPNYHD